MKKMLVISLAVLSLPALAETNQAHCEAQASAAVEAIRSISTSNAGVTNEQKQAIEHKLSKLDVLLDKKRYCEALQMATTS